MSEGLIVALSILWYFVVGAAGARGVFSWAVRTGNYAKATPYRMGDREDIHYLMSMTFFIWPLVLAGWGAWGISKLLRARPPESKEERRIRERETRDRLEKAARAQSQRIRELERSLGIGQDDTPIMKRK